MTAEHMKTAHAMQPGDIVLIDYGDHHRPATFYMFENNRYIFRDSGGVFAFSYDFIASGKITITPLQTD